MIGETLGMLVCDAHKRTKRQPWRKKTKHPSSVIFTFPFRIGDGLRERNDAHQVKEISWQVAYINFRERYSNVTNVKHRTHKIVIKQKSYKITEEFRATKKEFASSPSKQISEPTRSPQGYQFGWVIIALITNNFFFCKERSGSQNEKTWHPQP